MESRYNEVPRDWENVFVMAGVRYIGVLFHTFCYLTGRKISFAILGSSLHKGPYYRGSTVCTSVCVLCCVAGYLLGHGEFITKPGT